MIFCTEKESMCVCVCLRAEELAIVLGDYRRTTTCVFTILFFNAGGIFVKNRYPLNQHQLVSHERANRKRESIATRITKSTSATLLICQSAAEQRITAEGHLSKGSVRRNKRIIAVIVAPNDTDKLYSDRAPMLLAAPSFLLLSHPAVLLSSGALKVIAFCLPRPNVLRVKNTYVN